MRTANTLVSAAFRDSLHMDTLTAFDHTEAVYRWLQRTDAAKLGMHPDARAALLDLMKAAYDALAKARILTDWRAVS